MDKEDVALFAEQFRRLPDKLQETWFRWLFSGNLFEENNSAVLFASLYGFSSEWCESPIETVLYNCLIMMQFIMENESGNDYRDDFFVYLNIDPQHEIERKNGKKYRVDFYIDHDCLVEGKKGIVVECDGHDFHEKTKEQVIKRNERDLELKTMGYDVLHYSGSQIYNNPMKCAREIIEYFRDNACLDYEIMKRWREEFHNIEKVGE